MKSPFHATILACFILPGCVQSTEPIEQGLSQLDATVNGKAVWYSPDQQFLLAVDSYADAGYQWDWEISDTLVVALVGNPSYKPNNPNVCGGLCTATFRFRTNMSGICVVNLIEHQRWMKDVAPRATVRFSVVVR
jgi:hypothetical protein